MNIRWLYDGLNMLGKRSYLLCKQKNLDNEVTCVRMYTVDKYAEEEWGGNRAGVERGWGSGVS